MQLVPYINFSGNAEEAMNFYQGVLGGQTEIMRWSEMPPNPQMPVSDDWKNSVMHGALTTRDGVTIYFADSPLLVDSGTGNNVQLHLEFDSEDELRRVYEAFSDGGTVNMPVDRTFWGAVYGDLTDKFGISWGLHYQLPQ